MILITGGTGFVGKALTRHLVDMGYPIRLLIRPTPDSPNLPKGVPVDVALSALSDDRGLRAAMVGIDTVFHLATGEWRGTRASLMDIDIQGTRSVVDAAQDAGVRRFFYVSHLGADRASAFPVLKAKGIAEEHIRKSELDYTILRTAIVFGPNDGLTTGIARLLKTIPSVFLLPGNGDVLLQPMWVEDLITCLTWAMDDPQTIQLTADIGGPEYLPFRQVVELVMQATGMRRRLVSIGAPYLRGLTVWLESWFPRLPTSVYWLDYLAANRTTALDTVPRTFGLLPSRMSTRLAYLEGQIWQSTPPRSVIRRR
jgi:NADH dehydrogenase